MERVYEELNRFSWNEEELLTYDQSEKYYNSYVATMENKYEEGIEKSKMTIAQNMLKAGADEKFISQVTGLSFEQIKALK
jgi:predicted transposase/invertase (TIGR01784 family)